MWPEVEELVALGPLPDAEAAAIDMSRLAEYQRLLASISEPVSDEEAAALAQLFGPDDCFGLAWTLRSPGGVGTRMATPQWMTRHRRSLGRAPSRASGAGAEIAEAS